GQEGDHSLEELLVEVEIVGRIGEDEVEGSRSLLHQASKAGGKGEPADPGESFAESAGVGFESLHGAEVVVHGERAESAAADGFLGHAATAGEEGEDARAVEP